MRTFHTFGPTAINAAKSHCIRGHEFTPENTQRVHGKRRCRACIALRRTNHPGRNGMRYAIFAMIGLDASQARGQRLSRIIPEYSVWSDMRRRCFTPTHKNYAGYGGRGITVCPRWNSFTTFLADMGPRPSPKHSIDRKDNDGNYEPANCRWATQPEQIRNRRRRQPKQSAAGKLT
jgi:hypothetical protein